jgi:hypothetical protein
MRTYQIVLIVFVSVIILISLIYSSRVFIKSIPHQTLEIFQYKNGCLTEDGRFVGNHMGPKRNSLVIIEHGNNVPYFFTSDDVTKGHAEKLSGNCSNGRGPEDPRVFTLKGKEYILYCDNVIEDGQIKLRMFFSKIGDLQQRKQIELEGIQQANCEKNWSPWVINDKLYVSYFISPSHRVYQVDIDTGYGKFISKTTNPKARKLFGGTNAISYNGKMLGIAHIKLFTPFLKYLSVFYEFENKYPYSVIRIGKPFCFEKLPWCEFVTKLGINNDGKLVISYGRNDTESIIAIVDPKNIPWS